MDEKSISDEPWTVVGAISEELYRQYFDRLVKGDKQTCATIVQSVLDQQRPIKQLYLGLFQRSMYEIGSLWEKNQVSVATEHMTTAITERLLHLTYPALFQAPTTGQKAIIACCANEYHQLGAKITADFLEGAGWNSIFLGANTPVSDLLRMIEKEQPDIVGLSLSIYFNLPRLVETLETVHARFPELDILVGGQAFRHGGIDHCQIAPQVHYIDSLDTLEAFLKKRPAS